MFNPDTMVLDCNAALGRRYNERVAADTREDLLRAMSEAGISRAVVYNPYSEVWGTMEGNELLLEEIAGNTCLLPQFVVDFATDDFEEVSRRVRQAGIRSLRVFPKTHRYPFVHWIADPWLDWMAREGLALWIRMGYKFEVEARDLYETATRHPDVPIVLAGSHYSNYSIVWPILKAVKNLVFDLSRFDIPNGVERLIRHIGVGRLLYGSDYPQVDPEPYLYFLHRCGLRPDELRAICHDNLCRLLHLEG